MDIKAKVVKVLPEQNGKSERTGNVWRSLDFIVEYFENPSDRYPDSMALRVMNEKIDQLQLKEGDVLDLGVGHRVREYNGRHFNDLTAYRINHADGQQPAAQSQPAQPMPQTPPLPGAGYNPPF